MNQLDQYLNNFVSIELSGKIKVFGMLVDYGLDILVINSGEHYRYIPLMQVQNMRISTNSQFQEISNDKMLIDSQTDKISFRNILNNAKGLFTEIFVSGNQSIHGYVTSILNNYFVFYSPVYKTMFIALHHLKWLTPYNRTSTPYTLGDEHLPVHPAKMVLPRTFEEHLKKLEGRIVVFDIGDNPHKIGLLQKIENNLLELVTGEGQRIMWNIQHLKAVYTP